MLLQNANISANALNFLLKLTFSQVNNEGTVFNKSNDRILLIAFVIQLWPLE
jgi:hypothetical protein